MPLSETREKGFAWIWRLVITGLVGWAVLQFVDLPSRLRQMENLDKSMEQMKGQLVKVETQMSTITTTLALTDQMLRQSVLDQMKNLQDRLSKREAEDVLANREFLDLKTQVIRLEEQIKAARAVGPARP